MALRTFRATFTVVIDDNEVDDPILPPVNAEDLKNYLANALILGWANEDYGNPCGIQSMEMDTENLHEFPPTQEFLREKAVEQFGEAVVDEAEGYYETDYDKVFWRDLDEEERSDYLGRASYNLKKDLP